MLLLLLRVSGDSVLLYAKITYNIVAMDDSKVNIATSNSIRLAKSRAGR